MTTNVLNAGISIKNGTVTNALMPYAQTLVPKRIMLFVTLLHPRFLIVKSNNFFAWRGGLPILTYGFSTTSFCFMSLYIEKLFSKWT